MKHALVMLTFQLEEYPCLYTPGLHTILCQQHVLPAPHSNPSPSCAHRPQDTALASGPYFSLTGCGALTTLPVCSRKPCYDASLPVSCLGLRRHPQLRATVMV